MLEFVIFQIFADETNLFISGTNIEELETLVIQGNETSTIMARRQSVDLEPEEN